MGAVMKKRIGEGFLMVAFLFALVAVGLTGCASSGGCASSDVCGEQGQPQRRMISRDLVMPVSEEESENFRFFAFKGGTTGDSGFYVFAVQDSSGANQLIEELERDVNVGHTIELPNYGAACEWIRRADDVYSLHVVRQGEAGKVRITKYESESYEAWKSFEVEGKLHPAIRALRLTPRIKAVSLNLKDDQARAKGPRAYYSHASHVLHLGN